MEYNYQRFKLSDYDLMHFPGPKAGDVMPDFTLYDQQGNEVRLSAFRGKWLVIETGSTSCMMYARNVSAASRLIEKYPDVEFLVVYVREAHPGHKLPAHRSLNEKLELSKTLAPLYDEKRKVMVDSLEGDLHRTFGGLPNVIYLIDPQGKVVFRVDWGEPGKLDQALAHRNRLHEDDHCTHEHMSAPLGLSLAILLRSGRDALWDFLKAAVFLIPTHKKADAAFARRRGDGHDPESA